MSRKAFAASDAEWCYHGGELVRMGDVRLSPATHALNYGTGVFEGIRAYWSEEKGTLQVLKMREHYERFERSCRLLRVDLPVIEREVGRTELYAADEVFLSGTGFQIAPVVEVDDRPVGTGSIGPVAERLQELYFKAARGGWDEYADWTVAVEVAEGARQ